VVKCQTLSCASELPALSLTPEVMVAPYLLPFCRSPAGVKVATLVASS
jgi:hypothetical protein